MTIPHCAAQHRPFELQLCFHISIRKCNSSFCSNKFDRSSSATVAMVRSRKLHCYETLRLCCRVILFHNCGEGSAGHWGHRQNQRARREEGDSIYQTQRGLPHGCMEARPGRGAFEALRRVIMPLGLAYAASPLAVRPYLNFMPYPLADVTDRQVQKGSQCARVCMHSSSALAWYCDGIHVGITCRWTEVQRLIDDHSLLFLRCPGQDSQVYQVCHQVRH